MTWEIVRWLHLLAMAFFVGGQLVLAVAVVPALRGADERDRLRAIARRFGWGSLAALTVLLTTGVAMADRFELWRVARFQVKLTLVAAMGLLILWHMRRPQHGWIGAVVFAVSLAIAWLGVALSH